LLTLYIAGACIAGFIALICEPRLPRYSLLLLIAAIPQIGLVYGIDIAGMFLVTACCVALWGLSNRAIAGIPVIAFGMLLNLLAMAAHGGRMPVHQESVQEHFGQSLALGTAILGSKDIIVSGSPFALLSDHIPLVFDNFSLIASPGDVVVVIGIFWWLIASSTLIRRRAHDDATLDPHSQRHAAAVSSGG
jgi:Family of unknown function (DUF5317)